MDAFIQSGRLVDLILLLVVIEALALAVLRARFTRLPALLIPHPAVLWPTLLSGALLMLAVRLAITDADGMLLAGVLALAGLAHAADIALRVRAAR